MISRRTRQKHAWPPHGAKRIKQGWWRRWLAKEKIATGRDSRIGE